MTDSDTENIERSWHLKSKNAAHSNSKSSG